MAHPDYFETFVMLSVPHDPAIHQIGDSQVHLVVIAGILGNHVN